MAVDNTMAMPEVHWQIIALDDLNFITRQLRNNNGHNSALWNLDSTDYFIMVQQYGSDAKKPYWKLAVSNTFYRHVSFEEVLQSVPLEIQEKLLFNLDLFR